ncbi:hypothetical protein [Parasitella parasitica]|uniref:Uncharacterized protein n=1 Tax=Parasitella parasitica TaxID=35722 RepID=A0A0B7NC38_9FUNG|nr:hypothetical protein [Parasitella parasitica]
MTDLQKLDTFPTEILEEIFAHVLRFGSSALYPCTFVCKRFFRIAHPLLYEDVYLGSQQLANVASCLDIARGKAIKKITFFSKTKILDFEYTRQNVEKILSCIPNVETLRPQSYPSFHNEVLWEAMLNSTTQHPYLKQFTSDEFNWDRDSQPLCAQLTLRYKASLEKLVLFPIFADINRDPNYRTFKNHLLEFKSLKMLQLVGRYVKTSLSAELDELISVENPNKVIQSLEIVDSRLPTSALEYFKNKLSKLERLVFNTRLEEPCEGEYADWWNQMIYFCQPLQSYYINFSELNFENCLHLIRGSAKLSSTIATTPVILKMNFTEEARPFIEMAQGDSRIHLFSSSDSQDFFKNVDFAQFYECLAPYAPDVIKILSRKKFQVDAQDLQLKILKFAIALISTKAGSAHFENMVLNSLQFEKAELPEDARISELSFTNCTIHTTVLPGISLGIPKIDLLVLDGCLIQEKNKKTLDGRELMSSEDASAAAPASETILSRLGGITYRTVVIITKGVKKTYQYDEASKTYQSKP